MNFDEVWQEAERKGAEIVFWPSAYGGGMPLNGYAMIHSYYIVAVGQGNMIDITGREIEPALRPKPQQAIAALDLDRTLVHDNFNEEKIARLLREHAGEVEVQQRFDAESWRLLRAGFSASPCPLCFILPRPQAMTAPEGCTSGVGAGAFSARCNHALAARYSLRYHRFVDRYGPSPQLNRRIVWTGEHS